MREYSDNLTIFLLKGLRPEKYRDRVELRGALANIDISYLPDHLLQRVADGEHIMSVLASAVELGAAGGVDLPKLLGSGAEAGLEPGPSAAGGASKPGEIVVAAVDGAGGEREVGGRPTKEIVVDAVEVEESEYQRSTSQAIDQETDRPLNPHRDSDP